MSHQLPSTMRSRSIDRAVRPVVEALENRQLLSVSLDQGILAIEGTPNPDTIVVRTASMPGKLKVVVNGQVQLIERSLVQQIRILGGGGDDTLAIYQGSGRIDIPSFIDGGRGDDTIVGGAGNDTLLGGTGNDFIYGNGGDDRIAGGAGNDNVIGGDGKDNISGGLGDNDILRDAEDAVNAGPGKNKVQYGIKPNFPVATYTGTPTGYTPSQERFAYGLGDLTDKNYTNRGQGQAIAIVGAFHSPTLLKDLNTFSKEFGLPLMNKKNFIQVSSSGYKLLTEEGAATEAALDVQWAHAIAPGATIYMVEAASNSFGDMDQAIFRAITILNKKHHGGVVSYSWGSYTEDQTQVNFDGLFGLPSAKNITFTVASGDYPVPSAPATSPNVVAVGATSLYLDENGFRIPSTGGTGDTGDTGNQPNPGGQPAQGAAGDSEVPWIDSGGGPSIVMPAPLYQRNRGVLSADPEHRGLPDVAMNGDPATGLPVFNSYGAGGVSGWQQVGGTSASAPQFAGIVALANQLRAGKKKAPLGNKINDMIYRLGGTGPDAYFNDIISGGIEAMTVNGVDYPGYTAANGWDYASGWGSPKAQTLIPALAGERMVFTNRAVTFTGTDSAIYTTTNTGNGNGNGQQGNGNGQQGNGTGNGNGTGAGTGTNSGTGTGPGGSGASTGTQSWYGVKGRSTIQGLNTLNLAAVTMTFAYGTTALQGTVEIYGIDPDTGTGTPNAIDATTGALTPGTPVLLYRNGNTVSGRGMYEITSTGTGGTGGTGGTTTTTARLIAFQGTIDKKGKISGSYFNINADGQPIKNTFRNPNIGVVKGTFKS